MADEMRADDPIEGEYTDSELPADAVVPEHAEVNDGDWNDDEVVAEEVEVVVEDEGEYTDTDFDGDGRPDRRL